MGHQQQQRASYNLEMKAAASALLAHNEEMFPLITVSSLKHAFIQLKQGNELIRLKIIIIIIVLGSFNKKNN